MTTGLENKPLYYGLAAGLLVAVVLVVAMHYLVITGINEEIATLEGEIDQLETKIEQGRAAEKTLPQFREEVARLELELEKLKRILPSQRNTEEIIKKLKSLVDEGDFVLRSLTFPDLQAAPESDVYQEWPIEVAIDGRYHDLALLFDKLSNFSRIVNVDRFSVTALPSQDERTISTQFVAKTFVYIESEPEGAPGG
ncbi:MAG: type 4a pilus biogenesis protein PilO [Acidobacteria bacterium]|nr:type 4a pilus biogenesis protein PilO [Acidobacteriota bacterium]